MILDTLEKYEQAAGAQRGQGARNLRSHCGITQIGEDKSTREAPTHRDRQSQGTTDPTGGGGNCGHLQMATASWSIREPTKTKENMGNQHLLLVTVGHDLLLRVVLCESTCDWDADTVGNFPELTGMLIQWTSIFSNQSAGLHGGSPKSGDMRPSCSAL